MVRLRYLDFTPQSRQYQMVEARGQELKSVLWLLFWGEWAEICLSTKDIKIVQGNWYWTWKLFNVTYNFELKFAVFC
jgi:hypothetical protein